MAHKLVLVDPSPSLLKIIQMAFPEPEFEIFALEDGLEAIRRLSEISPDAILLNLSLPLKDGYEVGRWLTSQEDFKKTGLILLKNAFEPADPDKLGEIEHDGIVEKPFDSEALARMVREIIDRKKGPIGFPEESLIDEIPPTGPVPLSDGQDFSFHDGEEKLEAKMRDFVRGEILEMERELEKRLRASLLAELKVWLEKGKPS